MNDKGRWELVSPLPDCPAGTKGVYRGFDTWHFICGDDTPWIFYEDSMKRNPDIFKWVPEPERVRCPKCGHEVPRKEESNAAE